MTNKIILMANDKPGALVADFLKKSGDKIVRLYLHDENARKCSDEIIRNSSCSEIYYAKDLKEENHVKTIKELNADFIITVYWAHLLKPSIFKAVKDTVNFHPAFLPINRGWYPHVHSIIDGSELGVTLHRIDEGADTGPIWAQKKIELLPYDTAKTVYDRLQFEIVELFKKKWDKISKPAKVIISNACDSSLLRSNIKFNAMQPKAMEELKRKGANFVKWKDSELEQFKNAWLEVAEEELRQRKTPYIIARKINNKKTDFWKIEDMIIDVI